MTSSTSGGGTSSTSAGGASSTSGSTSGSTTDSTSGSTTSNTSSGTTGSTTVTGSTPLTDIDTDAEAEAVCERLGAELGSVDIESVTAGLCALTGLIGEAFGGGTCEMLQAECIASDEEDPMTMTEGCTADDVPDCDITVDEYTACTSARVQASFDAFAQVTCDSDIEAIGDEPADPPECAGLAERCPELATD